MNIKQAISLYGVSSIKFFVPMRPIRSVVGIEYTSSSDPEFPVLCEIVTDRYKPEEGYKIEIKSVYQGFGKEAFYISDFESMIRHGSVKMFIDASKVKESDLLTTLRRIVCGAKGEDANGVKFYDGILDDALGEAQDFISENV